MEPLGEALPNQEIFRRLAGAMGYTEPELYESDAEIIASVLRKADLGEDFASLAAKGRVPVSAEPVVQFADLTFPTASGRIEIASARAEADGHPRVPLPLADPRPAEGRLRLLSPASPWLLNDSFANVEEIAVASDRPPSRSIPPMLPSEAWPKGTKRSCPTRPVACLYASRCRKRSRAEWRCLTRAAGPSGSRRARTSTYSTPAGRRTWAKTPACTASKSRSGHLQQINSSPPEKFRPAVR